MAAVAAETAAKLWSDLWVWYVGSVDLGEGVWGPKAKKSPKSLEKVCRGWVPKSKKKVSKKVRKVSKATRYMNIGKFCPRPVCTLIRNFCMYLYIVSLVVILSNWVCHKWVYRPPTKISKQSRKSPKKSLEKGPKSLQKLIFRPLTFWTLSRLLRGRTSPKGRSKHLLDPHPTPFSKKPF